MAAKLHDELSGIVEQGTLTKQYRERLAEMCRVYEIELKPSSLERYLPAGRMMLKCQSLAFVNVTLLIDQQKATEKLLARNELMLELTGLAGGDARALPPKLLEAVVLDETIASVVSGLMKSVCAAAPDDLAVTSVNAKFSALDIARVLRMTFGNSGFGLLPVGGVQLYLIWEYISIVNTKLEQLGIKGLCVVESFLADRIPKEMDWIAIAYVELGVGFVLNWPEKKIVAHSYARSEEDAVQDAARMLAQKLKFPKKHGWEFQSVNGYEDVSLLHWLSRIVWGKGRGADCPVELLRLQVAYECKKLDLVPQDLSFLELIKREQPPHHFQVDEGSELNVESLMRTGFFIIRGLVPAELCTEDVVSELSRRVKQCKHHEVIFQGAHRNDGRRLQANVEVLRHTSPFSEALEVLIAAISDRLKVVVSMRPLHELNVLVSLEGCDPQRTHCDYTPESLKMHDDGFCGGLPLGIVVGAQPNTRFDGWPGAVGWDQSRFFEHQQLVLGPGDAVLFLGNAVHAGAGYAEENVRFHCYLENAELRQQRLPDSTYFVDIAAGVGNVLPRLNK